MIIKTIVVKYNKRSLKNPNESLTPKTVEQLSTFF